jgi:large exoprotein involved in heme utilization and adhesion
VKDLLLVRHNSQISAQSFGANSVDGNINIDARAIVAIPSENSDIIARSTNSGNIDITAKGLFGVEFREQLTPESDITATGRVTSNVPDINPSQESAQLSSEILDTDSLIAGSCIVRRNQPTRGSFTITGSGGLPQRPGDAQMSTFPTVDIETLPSDDTPSNTNPNRPWQKGDPIVEPQGVYRLPNGKLVLSRECSRLH